MFEDVTRFMTSGGRIDCGDSYEDKLAVLSALEQIGFKIGFAKHRADNYRFVYYDRGLYEIHMTRSYKSGDGVISVAEFMSMYRGGMEESDFEPCELSELYEFCMAKTQ